MRGVLKGRNGLLKHIDCQVENGNGRITLWRSRVEGRIFKLIRIGGVKDPSVVYYLVNFMDRRLVGASRFLLGGLQSRAI